MNDVENVLLLSEDARSLIYALEGLNGNVIRVASCMEQLEAIVGTTNRLAVNAPAAVEPTASALSAFPAVARQVRKLSEATQQSVAAMQVALKVVTDGIASGQNRLTRTNAIDLAPSVLTMDRLEILMSELVSRSASLTASISATSVRRENL